MCSVVDAFGPNTWESEEGGPQVQVSRGCVLKPCLKNPGKKDEDGK